MHSSIEQNRPAVEKLCRQHRVVMLDLFGSAVGTDFDSATSDLDFLVEFESLDPSAYAAAYFGLLEDLKALFGRSIDLVAVSAITNPYFRESVERTRVPLYAA